MRANRSWLYILERLNDFEMKKGVYSFINPYSMLRLRSYPEVAKQIDSWYVDGISLVHKLNDSGYYTRSRLSFDDTSLAPVVFSYSKENSLKIGIIGTKKELISAAVKNIEKKYGVQVEYHRHGYFSDPSERREVLKEVANIGIDVVICGMGTPYQEQFLIDLRAIGWSGFGFTCGGYLHQIAQKENYYPHLFNVLNIRWLYRIIDEPKLLKRYALHYPWFFVTFFLFLKGRKKRR